MKAPVAILSAASLFFAALLVQGCSNPAPVRKLLSVTVSPAAGTAQGAPGGVQFVATGTYNTAPYTVTPLQADWGVFDHSFAATTENGLATCKGAGTTTVEAWVQISGPTCNVIDAAGMPCGTISGRAKLTCP